MSTSQDPLKRAWDMIDILIESLGKGETGLDEVPKFMKTIIREESWREFIDRFGIHQRNATFAEWITSTPLKGLGEKTESVKRLLIHDPEALAAYDGALIGKNGGDRKSENKPISSDNVITDRCGNSKSYTLRRLKRERPDLFQSVVERQLSANAAAIEAGFRSRTVTVIPTVEGFVKAATKHLTQSQLEELKASL